VPSPSCASWAIPSLHPRIRRDPPRPAVRHHPRYYGGFHPREPPLTDRRSGDDRRSSPRTQDRRGRPKSLPEIAIAWAKHQLATRTQEDVASQLQVDQSTLSRYVAEIRPTALYCCPICSYRCAHPEGHDSCRKAA
jgi:hypothetical protein